jgi:serine/threonine protein kinase
MNSWPIGTQFKHRYELMRLLQQRDANSTFLAKDLQTDTLVIVKCLNLSAMSDWQDYKLFERELEALTQLKHPRIPPVLDHFEVENDQNRTMALVITHIEGQTLRERLNAGWKVNEASARQLAEQALDILSYLQAQDPPIIHRDIKPENLILDQNDRLYLIDFGAMKAINQDSQTTVAGTFGYMAPEQALGGQHAQPASDLYALGITLLEMLTRQPPQNLPRKDLQIDFHDLVNATASFEYWLEQMLEPDINRRLGNAQVALKALKEDKLPALKNSRARADGRLQLQKTAEGLRVCIAPAHLADLLQLNILQLILASLGWAILVTVLVTPMIMMIFSFLYSLLNPQPALVSGPPHAYIFMAQALSLSSRLYIFWRVLRQAEAPLRQQNLSLKGKYLQYEISGWLSQRKKSFDLEKIKSISVKSSGLVIEMQPQGTIKPEFQSWLKRYAFPASLSETEQHILQRELRQYLREKLPPEKSQQLLNNSF